MTRILITHKKIKLEKLASCCLSTSDVPNKKWLKGEV